MKSDGMRKKKKLINYIAINLFGGDGICGVIVTIVENGHSDPSSNPGRVI